MTAPPGQERVLEGWSPRIPDEVSLADAIDLAFDYRGDVTLGLVDGTEVVGYLFNRAGDGPEPVVQLYVAGQAAPRTIPYAAIQTLRFSGRDTEAGNTYAAWLKRREVAQPAPAAPRPDGA